MPGNLKFPELKKRVAAGEIDTVLTCLIDMQGRLMGKRFEANFFVNSAFEETHSCNYLLATDMEMTTVKGYASTSWASGYGDYIMKPDLSTLRVVPWLEGTAMVLCDVLDHATHKPVAHSPRAILKRQVARLGEMGLKPMMATELEFFLFRENFAELAERNYSGMRPISAYNEDYHIFQTTKEEHVMRAIRNGLYGAGIPVECTKGEADAGQEEVNIKYSDALDAADNHAITKNACKEIAWQKGHALTFLAKWHHDAAGSSSHVHQSLWSMDGKAAFFDPKGAHTMSQTMGHYLAGLLSHASDITYFLAPYINSYKRFAAGTFAPTKAVWSMDNRTAGYRVVGEGTKSVRVECRVGGSDLNPYLALAAQIAAGIAGIEGKLALEKEFKGDAYTSENARSIPHTLLEATKTLDNSKMLRAAFGDDVIDHYVRAAKWEQEVFDCKVTDFEVARGFERA
ncbi:glutamine synthetase family protein [hydrothermal vent metagenome]|uniref:Glutamine synthetase family protein n=1 Tax=hydrothermal vent metagenome TaxID=652676 RepID=A0A3B0TZP6_9ZZZZ